MPNDEGQEEKPNDSKKNGHNQSNSLQKWVEHLWSRDPDRQVELILAAAIALFAFVQLILTVVNNYSTSQQVDKIIAVAGSIRDSAGEIRSAGWTFSGAAIGINNANWNAVGRLQDQADQVKRSAAAAENAVKATQEQMRLDQRAWVGFANVTAIIKPGEHVAVSVSAVIFGKSPAVNIVTRPGIVWFPPSYSIQQKDLVPGKNNIFDGTAIPGASFLVNDTVYSPADLSSDVLGGRQTVYFFGETRYHDVFSRPHWTHFCYIITSSSDSQKTDDHPCSIYNDSDADYPSK